MIETTRRVLLILGLALATGPAAAQEADFSDETVTVYIRSSPGGGYDDYGRLVARHLGKHLPGEPDVVAVNMPGAGGIVAANYLARQAKRDGTEIAILDRGAALAQRLGQEGVAYDVAAFAPLGSAASEAYTFVVRPETGVGSLSELLAHDAPLKFSVTGPGSSSYTYTELLQSWGAPVEMITGYNGTAEKNLAVVRGEVDGTASDYAGILDFAADEGLVLLGVLGRAPDRPELETVAEVAPEGQQAVVAVAAAPLEAGRPFFAPPEVPKARLTALQDAFRAALEDPELRAEAEKMGRPIDYLPPDAMAALHAEVLAAPDAVIEKFRE